MFWSTIKHSTLTILCMSKSKSFISSYFNSFLSTNGGPPGIIAWVVWNANKKWDNRYGLFGMLIKNGLIAWNVWNANKKYNVNKVYMDKDKLGPELGLKPEFLSSGQV